MPVVAVSPEGAVAITYYDFRKDTPDPAVLLTNLWKIVSHDGGETWTETAVTDTFDMMQAPILTGNQPMIGDYVGLAAVGNAFLSFFVTTNSTDGISDILATSASRPIDPSTNGHIEVVVSPVSARHTKAPRK